MATASSARARAAGAAGAARRGFRLGVLLGLVLSFPSPEGTDPGARIHCLVLLLDAIGMGAAGAFGYVCLHWLGFATRRPALGPAAPVLLLAAAAAGIASLSGLASTPAVAPDGAPEIVLVTLDTTRADRYAAVAAAEDGGALEAGAARFSRVWAAAGLTAPSHASLFTGELPSRHGLRNNGGRLDPRTTTLAESLHAAGWSTLAATSVLHLDPGFGFGAGFERFARCEDGLGGLLRPAQGILLPNLLLRLAGAGRPARSGPATLAAARALWREAPPVPPRFLWVHLFEPHWPYQPAGGPLVAGDGAAAPLAAWPPVPLPGFDPAAIAPSRAHYDGEIRDVRRLLDAFLAELRASSAARGRELLVVVTADHGEALGEHGASDHGDLPYDEGLRVPLWVAGPGVRPREIEAPLSLVDLRFGLLAWLGINGGEVPAPHPFASALRGDDLPAGAEVPIETDHADFRSLALVVGERKAILHERVTPAAMLRKPLPARELPADLPWLGELELYDLAADPHELHDLAPALSERERQRWLTTLRQRLASLPPAGMPVPGLRPEVRDALAELGYLGARD